MSNYIQYCYIPLNSQGYGRVFLGNLLGPLSRAELGLGAEMQRSREQKKDPLASSVVCDIIPR